MSELISLLHPVNTVLVDFHQSRLLKVVRRSDMKNVAFVIDQRSPRYFTAAEIFSLKWVIVPQFDEQTAEMCAWIQSRKELGDGPIELIEGEGASYPENVVNADKQEHAFWVFTPKDEVGPVHGAIARAVYSILRKYGESAIESIGRLC